eukprot:gene9575-17330_t
MSKRQRIVINGEISDWSNVASGVPQESVLGPILFLCFINDLPSVIQETMEVFAEDIEIYTKVNNANDCENLQERLAEASDSSKQWGQNFHP